MTRNAKMLCLATAVLAASTFAADDKATQADEQRVQKMAEDVRKAIVTVPEFSVFDYLWFGIKDNVVVLRGFASRPTLKSGAENVAKRVKGVEQVKNEIEVLPLSPNDDRIRAGAYARIYGSPTLQRYTANRPMGRNISRTQVMTGITNNPPLGFHAIHIIVKNGDITLHGVVDNSADAAMAEMQARMTPGSFTVYNELSVAKEEK